MKEFLTNKSYAQQALQKLSSSQANLIEITSEMSDEQIAELNTEITRQCNQMQEIGFTSFENLRHKFTSKAKIITEFNDLSHANYAKNLMQQIVQEFQTFSPEKQRSLAKSMQDFNYGCGPGSINEMQETINFLKISKFDFHCLIIETKSQIINDLITDLYRDKIFEDDFSFYEGNETHHVHKLYNSIAAEFLLEKFPLDHDDFAKSDPTPEMQSLIKKNIEQKFDSPDFEEFFINKLSTNIHTYLDPKQINAFSARIKDLKLGITANLLLDISKQKVEFNQAHKEIITEAVRLKLRKLELIPEQNLEFSQQILKIASESSDCGISKETIEKADEKLLHFIMQHNLLLDADECQTRNIFEYVSIKTLDSYLKTGKSINIEQIITKKDLSTLSQKSKQYLASHYLKSEASEQEIIENFATLIKQFQDLPKNLVLKGTIKSLVQNNKFVITEKLINLKTNQEEYSELLIELIKKDQIDLANKLMSSKINFNITDEYGVTALIYAAKKGYKEITFKLIEAGANLDIADENGDTALILAIEDGDSEIAIKLIEAGANLDIANKNGHTALILAIEDGDSEIAIKLIEAGANLDIANKNGHTALILAIEDGDSEIAIKLIEAGANLDIANKNGHTALILAIEDREEKITAKLIEAGANLDIADENGDTALLYAVDKGQIDLVIKLIAANADLNIANKYGFTALIWAIEKGCKEIAIKLIEAGADLNHSNSLGETALFYAIRGGHKDIAFKLIEAGVDLKFTNHCKATALICAAIYGHKEIVEKLIAAQADLDIKNKKGNTALIYAAKKDNNLVTLKLIEAKADLNIANKYGYTALMRSARKGNTEIAEKLIAAKADLNIVNKKGNTALLLAISQGHIEIAKKLIEAGADLNIVNKKEETALFLAVSKGHTEIAKKINKSWVFRVSKEPSNIEISLN